MEGEAKGVWRGRLTCHETDSAESLVPGGAARVEFGVGIARRVAAAAAGVAVAAGAPVRAAATFAAEARTAEALPPFRLGCTSFCGSREVSERGGGLRALAAAAADARAVPSASSARRADSAA